MKIVQLYAENFKRLKAVHITPDGALVPITGANGQGKSSVLDAIKVALIGKAAAPPRPIRDGEEKCTIKLDLGELDVIRTFTRTEDGADYTTSLTIMRPDGSRISAKPQAVLDALYSELTIDPLEFESSKPEKQFELLKAFVKGFDFEANTKARKEAFESRTDYNRQAKSAQTRADGIRLPPGTKPTVKPMDELLAEHRQALNHNVDVDVRANNRQRAEQQIADLAAEIDSLEERLETLNAQKSSLAKRLAEAPPLPEKIDVSILEGAIALQTGFAEQAGLWDEKARLETEAKAFAGMSDKLTEAIDALDKERADAIAKSKMPIEGLGLEDGMVTLDGQPFEQASDAQRLRASIAIAGAMAPKLKVIRVRDGSRLDSKGLAMVAEYAEANDLQVWVEKVDETGQVGFVIEDGELRP